MDEDVGVLEDEAGAKHVHKSIDLYILCPFITVVEAHCEWYLLEW